MYRCIKSCAPIIFLLAFAGAVNAGVPAETSHQTAQDRKQSSESRPATGPGSQPASGAADAKKRQQAYLKFLEAHRLRGEAQRLRNSSLIDGAIEAYQETIRLDPTSADPHVDLGELYFLFQNRRDLAMREAREALRLDPKSAGAHLLLGRLFLYSMRADNSNRSANLEGAIGHYEKVADLDPSDAETWAILSDLYARKNDTAKQLHALEKWAGAPVPNDTLFYSAVMNSELSSDQAYYRLSQIYLEKGRNKDAVAAARRAYESNPESTDYARNLISILRVAGTSAEELRTYSQLMKSVEGPALMIGYSSALVRAGQYAKAIEILTEYVKFDSSNAAATVLLAMAQRRANRRPAAVETLKAGIAKVESGVRTDMMLELGQTYEEMGRNDEAMAQYEQIFEVFLAGSSRNALSTLNNSLFGEVVNRLARICRRTRNQAKLQSVLQRARRVLDEQSPLLDLISIESVREDGKKREALDLARAASRRYKDDRSLKFTESLILSEMGRFQESAELLRSMLSADTGNASDDAYVHLILSNVMMQWGRLRDAEASARKALEQNPGDSEALVQLSSVLDRAGNHDESEKILRDLITREPDNATALNNLGYFMIERGAATREALKYIEQANAIDPINGSFLDSLGWAHFKLGNVDKARENLEKALIYTGRNSTIHEHLGDVLLEAGRLAEARKHWEKALEYSVEAGEISRLRVKLKSER
jgi:tetratricopeptide (TPR) repeat protein